MTEEMGLADIVNLIVFLQILQERGCLFVCGSIVVSRTTPCATVIVVGSVSAGAAFVIASGKFYLFFPPTITYRVFHHDLLITKLHYIDYKNILVVIIKLEIR
jgi:hypothetical protein